MIQTAGILFISIFVKIEAMMDIAIETPVTLTAGAVKELTRLMNEPGFDNSQHLRVGVKGGGCSGMTYVLGFDQKQDGDDEFEIAGIKCVMTRAHEIYLMGMEIDFQGGLNSRGFTFSNPNASKTCGCGTSFAV
jgi:iron-sulfur cluster assembly accessory protein